MDAFDGPLNIMKIVAYIYIPVFWIIFERPVNIYIVIPGDTGTGM